MLDIFLASTGETLTNCSTKLAEHFQNPSECNWRKVNLGSAAWIWTRAGYLYGKLSVLDQMAHLWRYPTGLGGF